MKKRSVIRGALTGLCLESAGGAYRAGINARLKSDKTAIKAATFLLT